MTSRERCDLKRKQGVKGVKGVIVPIIGRWPPPRRASTEGGCPIISTSLFQPADISHAHKRAQAPPTDQSQSASLKAHHSRRACESFRAPPTITTCHATGVHVFRGASENRSFCELASFYLPRPADKLFNAFSTKGEGENGIELS